MKLEDLKTITQLTEFLSGTQAVALTGNPDKRPEIDTTNRPPDTEDTEQPMRQPA